MTEAETRPCDGCRAPISYETGFTFAHDGLFCSTCRPVVGGYTLSDLERMREEGRAQRGADTLARHARFIEEWGADVFFHVLGAPPNADGIDS